MAFMIWTDKLSVGVTKIDDEHKPVIEMIDALYAGLLDDAALPALENVFDRLIGYTDTHFSNEEALYGQAQYPDLSAHREKHAKLKKAVAKYREQLHNGNGRILAAEMLHFLKSWWTHHILEDDKKVCAFLNAKNIH